MIYAWGICIFLFNNFKNFGKSTKTDPSGSQSGLKSYLNRRRDFQQNNGFNITIVYYSRQLCYNQLIIYIDQFIGSCILCFTPSFFPLVSTLVHSSPILPILHPSPSPSLLTLVTPSPPPFRPSACYSRGGLNRTGTVIPL